MKSYLFRLGFILFLTSVLAGCGKKVTNGKVNILILSGQNNHEWQKTTPLLVRIYEQSALFNISVTEKPDTLSYHDLKDYDVLVSNWNTWPDNELRMSKEWEQDFTKFVRKGGGTVFIHAGASSFYGWNDYHQIGIGRWGKETHHGKPAKGKVTQLDREHPITKGISDFYIIDELWEKAEISGEARALASLTGTDETDGHEIMEKAVFVHETDKGRSFYTILGHDERALLNSGLQTLLLRGTLWAAKREIYYDIPAGLKNMQDSYSNSLFFDRSDTTFGLINGEEIIWQYNFNNRYGKQYFHPVSALNSTLTCVSPPDHPWHMGLWFSWKFINDLNYWEYLDNYKSDDSGYRSEGITTIQENEFSENEDFSADLRLHIVYKPYQGEPVMSEKSNIHISAPMNDGSYYIDFDNAYTALSDEVILDRTPVRNEPGGRSWGGYAGLSVRFSQDYTSPVIIAPDESDNYKQNDWVYMGFNTLTGETAGMCILKNPEFTTNNTKWYVINTPEIPFFYYSPAALYDGKIVLKKDEQLRLKYRVWIIPGKSEKEDLQAKYDSYMTEFAALKE